MSKGSNFQDYWLKSFQRKRGKKKLFQLILANTWIYYDFFLANPPLTVDYWFVSHRQYQAWRRVAFLSATRKKNPERVWPRESRASSSSPGGGSWSWDVTARLKEEGNLLAVNPSRRLFPERFLVQRSLGNRNQLRLKETSALKSTTAAAIALYCWVLMKATAGSPATTV